MNYYDKHADAYVTDTLSVNMAEQYDLFLPHLPKGASILDAGCGSGRDSKAFLNLGYTVQAFDSSLEMVRVANQVTGLAVRHLCFQEMDWDQEFDGIWASASLLHVRREELIAVFSLLHRALKPNGVLYASFKERRDDFIKGERLFTCFTADTFSSFLEKLDLFHIISLSQSEDLRPDRKGEGWLNIVMRKE
ncbi:MAG: class I SAM-dependent methyltransferase [Sphaerochaeta sp.]|jgi:2-polyprenyl-3-methyl-5-hydroxy-6-metoxy-1,4-benzoquinol methylase|nr:class I SAM-dependent methyltransferase [Spirochaetales bacterium]